jgi:hypothetical protein
MVEYSTKPVICAVACAPNELTNFDKQPVSPTTIHNKTPTYCHETCDTIKHFDITSMRQRGTIDIHANLQCHWTGQWADPFAHPCLFVATLSVVVEE